MAKQSDPINGNIITTITNNNVTNGTTSSSIITSNPTTGQIVNIQNANGSNYWVDKDGNLSTDVPSNQLSTYSGYNSLPPNAKDISAYTYQTTGGSNNTYIVYSYFDYSQFTINPDNGKKEYSQVTLPPMLVSSAPVLFSLTPDLISTNITDPNFWLQHAVSNTYTSSSENQTSNSNAFVTGITKAADALDNTVRAVIQLSLEYINNPSFKSLLNGVKIGGLALAGLAFFMALMSYFYPEADSNTFGRIFDLVVAGTLTAGALLSILPFSAELMDNPYISGALYALGAFYFGGNLALSGSGQTVGNWLGDWWVNNH